MEISLRTKLRWTARDSVCLGLAVFVVINVIMCIWVVVTSTSTARRQATAVFFAVEKASVIEFNLTLQTTVKRNSMPINVTGSLQPRFSECSRRLHFDGRAIVTTANLSEVFVLKNHRGFRRQLSSSSTNATCLTTRDIPPLHTLADTVHSAFRPLEYETFAVDCKPLQFIFYNMPFVACAEDWLRAGLQAHNLTHSTRNNHQSTTELSPVLVIHGKKSVLQLTTQTNSIPVDIDQPFDALNDCEYLEAPMTSGESCLSQTVLCPNLSIGACKK